MAGPLVRLACQRHMRDRELAYGRSKHPGGWWFDDGSADFIIRYFETVLRLPDMKDEHGEHLPFLLHSAQDFIAGSIFGWKGADFYRRFREAYIEMGKGNGKTPLFAGFGLYGMTEDEEQAAEIYAAAVTKDQAKILFRDAERIVKCSPELRDRLALTVNNIADPETDSFFRPFSRDEGTRSGPRPHMGLIDEVHEHQTGEIILKIQAGAKRRPQPFFGEITNSGFDRTSICWQHHEHARLMLEGQVEDDRLFAYICSLDDAKTDVYHCANAVQTMVKLCSCERVSTTQIDQLVREECARHATNRGIANRAPIDVLSTQVDQSDQQACAPSATSESDERIPNTEHASKSTSRSGPLKTASASLDTRKTGSLSDQAIDARWPSNRNSGPTAYHDRDSTSLSQSRAAHAVYVARHLDTSRSTTITPLASIEVSSVSNAIADSVFSAILPKVYNSHSPTCNVRQLGTVKGPEFKVEYPADDPLTDRSCWIKTNPLLGVSVTEEYLARQVQNATNKPAELNTVLRLNFCVWTAQNVRLIPTVEWAACSEYIADAELRGKPCYGGLDLGQSDDFSAWARLWDLLDGRVAVRMRFWIPDAALKKYPHRMYDVWRRAGVLTITQGNTTDYDVVQQQVLEDCREWGVRQAGFDKRFADQMAQNLQGAGITMVDTPQGFYFTAAIRKLLDLVVDADLCHGADPVLSWMAGNAEGRQGRDGQIRLDKEESGEKIDGISALVTAIDRWIGQPAKKTSIYQTRGIIST